MAKYQVLENEQITASTLLITLKLVEGSPMLFQAGQYAAINGYKGNRPMPIRCFSIVSSPIEDEILQFSMRVRGKFTHAVAKIQKGEMVHVQGPYGGFVLGANQHKNVVMMAGGIGITPFISMIRYATTKRSDTKMTLLYSVANQDDVPFLNELRDAEKDNPSFNLTVVVGEGPTDKLKGVKLASGRLDNSILEHATGPRYGDVSTVYYICGPPPFMKAMVSMLKSRGVSKNRLVTEAFSQGKNRQVGKVRDWPFSMYVLTALGLSTSLIAVMTSDLMKIIPKNITTDKNKQLKTEEKNNIRTNDLDALINELPGYNSTTPKSDAVNQALAEAAAIEAANAAITGQSYTPSSGSSSTSTSNPTTSGSSSPAAPQVTAPTPTCTTTQSGVTTCM